MRTFCVLFFENHSRRFRTPRYPSNELSRFFVRLLSRFRQHPAWIPWYACRRRSSSAIRAGVLPTAEHHGPPPRSRFPIVCQVRLYASQVTAETPGRTQGSALRETTVPRRGWRPRSRLIRAPRLPPIHATGARGYPAPGCACAPVAIEHLSPHRLHSSHQFTLRGLGDTGLRWRLEPAPTVEPDPGNAGAGRQNHRVHIASPRIS